MRTDEMQLHYIHRCSSCTSVAGFCWTSGGSKNTG